MDLGALTERLERGRVVPGQRGQVALVTAQRGRQELLAGRPDASAGGVGEPALADPHDEHGVPLEALGPVDGEQLDRVGRRRGRDVETLAVVLGVEPGEQRRQGDRAVDGLELGDRLDEEVEVVAAGAGGVAHRRRQLDVDAAAVDDPADQVEQRLAGVAPQLTQLGGEQREPSCAPPRSRAGRRGRRARRSSETTSVGSEPATACASSSSTDAGRRRGRAARPARSRARRPSRARSRGPIAHRGPVEQGRAASRWRVRSWTRVSVATHLGHLGQPEQPLEADDLDRDLARGQRVEHVGRVGVVAGQHADLAPPTARCPPRGSRAPGRRARSSSSA